MYVDALHGDTKYTCQAEKWIDTGRTVSRVSCGEPAVVKLKNWAGREECLCKEHATELASEILKVVAENVESNS